MSDLQQRIIQEREETFRQKHADFLRCLERLQTTPDNKSEHQQNGDNGGIDGSDNRPLSAELSEMGDWRPMAEELGWRIDEVQTHAYQYLTALMRCEISDSEVESSGGIHAQARPGEHTNWGNGENLIQNGDHGPVAVIRGEWSQEEKTLFDTLLAMYQPRNSRHSPAGGSRAANGGTEIQVQAEHSWLEVLAAQIPGKTIEQIRERFQQLMKEKRAIQIQPAINGNYR